MAHSTNIPWINSGVLDTILEQFAYELYTAYQGEITLDIAIFGGVALIVKHPQARVSTVDIDAFIRPNVSSFNTKQFIEGFARKYGYIEDWMNQDVIKTGSFSIRMLDRMHPYKELYGCCRLYIVNDIDQLCMKAIAGRDKDIKDIKALCPIVKQAGFSYTDYVDNLYRIFGRTPSEINSRINRTIQKRLN